MSLSFSARLFLDVADVLLVAALFYRILTLVRGTRAAQMFVGLAALALLSVVAEWLQLNALDWLLSSLKTVWVIGFLIVFQPELRKGLAQVGGSRLFKKFLPVADTARLGEIQKALDSMSRKGVGAIVVIERNVGLRSYVETGTPIEALVTAELLETIFTPPSPLHDGAVIIRGNQIVAAGCILPLSQNPEIERTLGTRHRAIVGLSEETDAVAIAVSEETTQISVADRGVMTRLKSPAELRSFLGALLLPKREDGSSGSAAEGRQASAPPQNGKHAAVR